MIVYRLARSKFANDLSGKGAELSGGRWNSKGRAMLYTSSSRALCTAEVAVHTPLGIIPEDYILLCIALPENSMEVLDMKRLPENWRAHPPLRSTQMMGDDFITSEKALVLKVPSAVVQGDFNFLINPNHKECKEVKIVSKEFIFF